MKTCVVLILVLLFAAFAEAQTTQTARFILTWQHTSGANPNVNDAPLGFVVDRCTGASCTTFAEIVRTTVATPLTYTDTIAGDTGNLTRCYRVAAYNTAGQSGWSNIACGTSPKVSVTPGAPVSVNITINVTVP